MYEVTLSVFSDAYIVTFMFNPSLWRFFMIIKCSEYLKELQGPVNTSVLLSSRLEGREQTHIVLCVSHSTKSFRKITHYSHLKILTYLMLKCFLLER